MGDRIGEARTLIDLGEVKKSAGDLDAAFEFFNQGLSISRELGDKMVMASTETSIGDLFNQMGSHHRAVSVCRTGLFLANEIESIDIQRDARECLFTAYRALGKTEQALVNLEFHKVLEDSINKQETAKKLEQMEFAKQILADSLIREEEKLKMQMEHQEEVRKKTRTQNILMGSGLLFLLLAGGLYSRVNYIRKAKKKIEKERDRSEYLLHNILPDEVASELKETGASAAREFDCVSILFTDFKEFTQLSENLSASQLVEEINVCFKAFDGICEKYNLEKIKTIGDAYMAAGGLPVPYDEATVNTVMAALEMMAFIELRKKEKKVKGELCFGMRAGVHTGPVVAGIVGVKKFQYDVWGDTVNTASRMESNGQEGCVNISHSTYTILKDDPRFKFESRGMINAKGKGRIEMYFVSLNA